MAASANAGFGAMVMPESSGVWAMDAGGLRRRWLCGIGEVRFEQAGLAVTEAGADGRQPEEAAADTGQTDSDAPRGYGPAAEGDAVPQSRGVI